MVKISGFTDLFSKQNKAPIQKFNDAVVFTAKTHHFMFRVMKNVSEACSICLVGTGAGNYFCHNDL